VEIRNLIACANATGEKITIRLENGEYTMQVLFNNDTFPIRCTAQRGHDRKWKSLDVLIKHITQNNFSGKVEIEITQQQNLC